MKISYNWLNQYHDLDLSPDKVAEILTGCGLEVENMETFRSVKGGLKGVIIGEVLTCEKHPDSDHLSITTVDVGSGEALNIVCGAANVAKGQKVVVATIGTTLYLHDKELKIQRTKIRGMLSDGMICAEDELGLGTSHAGIMVLDSNAPVGMAAGKYFEVEEDVVFTIGLTPNRIDASSHIGVARDLVSVVNNYGKEHASETLRKIIVPDVSNFKVDNDNRHINVVIEDLEACPRYSGITVSGIHVTESPDWLKNRLISIGLRPINNIVDITNYILMETGQPLHAFDTDLITDKTVIIKKYPKGTKFVTLDSIERELSENDLMICNEAEPMCIAGIFGGAKSGVTDKTTSVFLESACFDSRHIRKSSRLHGLQTDASFRFERGTNHDITVYALKRAAMMIKEIVGGEITSEIEDIYPNPIPPQIVHLSYQNLDRLVGKVINREVVKNILTDLGIVLLDDVGPGLGISLEIPAYKVDVTREADVIEEILRVFGYNNIEVHDQLRSSISYTSSPDPEAAVNVVSDYLAANGFYEIMNNSLTRSTYYTENPEYPVEKAVKMLNPISRELDVMRQTLLYGALESIVYNQNRKISDVKMFEFGRVYSTGIFENDPLPGYHEENHLALIMTGRSQPENWNTAGSQVDFYDMKGYLEGIFCKLAVSNDQWQVEPFHSSEIEDGLQYLLDNRCVVKFGALSNQVLKTFDCRQPVYYAELNWDVLFSMAPRKSLQNREISKFPEVRRDLALLVGHDITFGQIRKLAFKTERKLLKAVGLFDVYDGKKIPDGKKSYAMSFILQDESKTLTDKEIERVMERLLKAMVTEFNVQLR
ncbi:MAG: phenylalanine--tRNA ligase subunit beta [Bacteroidales bacterium]|nr:phenylalanine--tRNA ligase subunit beta [Bacteroidales bacterium]